MKTQYSLFAACAPIIALVVTLLLTRLMLRSPLFSKIQDIPNARSLHESPVPRFGGLALMLGILTAWFLLANPLTQGLYAGVIFLMLLSLMDDLRDLPSMWRLLGHSVVAIGFVGLGLGHLPIYWAVMFAVGLVWMINLYNFMDGANGLAGGMAVIGFGFYVLAAFFFGDVQFALMNLVIVASSLAFLTFNFGRAKVFMGDAGSVPLGFLAAAIGLIGWQKGIWPLLFPLIVFSSFIMDATVTLFKRLLRGEKVWEAHREHYYQRVIQMGWSHQKTALLEYGMMTISGIVALLSLHLSLLYAALLLFAFFSMMFFIMYLVDVKWRKYA